MSRKLFFTTILFFTSTLLKAQQFTLKANFNSGLFKYQNHNPGFLNQVNFSSSYKIAYTNHPTGGGASSSYGASLTVQYQTRYHLVYGIDAGIESLASQQKISRAFAPSVGMYYEANGKTSFRRDFLNGFVFAGYEKNIHEILLTAKLGFELARQISSSHDKGSARLIANDSMIVVDRKIPKPDQSTDLRFRFQLEASYKQVGLYVGYSYGLQNYYSGWIGGLNSEAYVSYLRLGLSYRLNKRASH